MSTLLKCALEGDMDWIKEELQPMNNQWVCCISWVKKYDNTHSTYVDEARREVMRLKDLTLKTKVINIVYTFNK